MNRIDKAAAMRRNTIAELVEQMRAAQRGATFFCRIDEAPPTFLGDPFIEPRPNFGVWRGGC